MGKQFQNTAQEVAIESKIAIIEMYRGKVEKGITTFSRFVKFYEQQKDAELLSEMLFNLGRAYSLQGNWKVAKMHFKNSYNICSQEIATRSADGKLIYQLGFSTWKLGDWNAASQIYTQGMDIFKMQKDDINLIQLLLGFAELEMNKEKLPIATDYCIQGLQLATKFDYRRMQAKAYHILGEIEMRMGNFRKSEANHRKGIMLFSEMGNKIEMGFTMNDLSILLILSGKLSEAKLLLEKCAKLFHETKSIEGIAQTSLHLGFLEQEKKNYSKADYFFSKALTLFQEIGYAQGHAKSLLGKGCVQIQRKDLRKALEYLENALGIFDKLDGIKTTNKNLASYNRERKIHAR